MKIFKNMDKDTRLVVLLGGGFILLILFILTVAFIPSKQAENPNPETSSEVSGELSGGEVSQESGGASAGEEYSDESRTIKEDTELSQQIFERINQYRADHQKAALSWGDGEARIAQARCEAIARENQTTELHREAEISFYFTGESPPELDGILTAWTQSEESLTKILDDDSVRMGVSVYRDSQSSCWIIVTFNDGM